MTEPDEADIKSEIEEISARIDTIIQNIETHFNASPPADEAQA